ncbi:MAG: alpha-2-macroglobulin family protein, partial [Candidatus Eisenbacteria bacterium]|nr:alpha-2-macroglobulin family protein [Candidatus Eisenbacteria bacterium]
MSLDPWKLDFDVTTDRAVYEPGNEVTIVVTGGDAARAAGGKVTLAVVDDAIFQLSGEPSVDPWNAIFQWRGPGTDYKDVRQDLHLPARGEKGRITPGGDGGEEGGGPRKRFVPTAAFAPLLPIGADGRAVYRFRLPDDLTRFRVRALASAGVDLFGYEETKFDVRKGLQLEWSAPRFVRDGDRLDLVAVARNNGPEKIDARVSVSVRGARIDGKAEKKLSKIPAGGGARAVFAIRDPAAPGIEVTMRAQAGGGLEDAATFTIPFEKPVLWERDFLAARLEPSYRTTIALDLSLIHISEPTRQRCVSGMP